MNGEMHQICMLVSGARNAMGLTGEGVPALSDKEDDRERCRTVISDIDFESLSERAVYQQNLAFPVLPERDKEAGVSGSIAGGREANGSE